ncbi:hypothetical protein NLU13_3101 [Sarocladium strictum]|uniref:SANT domain-containing protein n=1 Tax=Sarocladium strictum TaxID=5046 RepID=A0AA39GLP9_SARSR|nr:hypothetical protein NLU13_3101 [Sarocladium strictum]
MSSMFKKKGGPAFKPKIPSARSRPISQNTAKDVLQEASLSTTESSSRTSQPDTSVAETNLAEAAPAIVNAPPPSPRKSARNSARSLSESVPPPAPKPQAIEPSAATAVVAEPLAPSLVSQGTVPTPETSAPATPVSEEATAPAPSVSTRARQSTATADPAEEAVEDSETHSRPKKRQRKNAAQDGEATPKPRQRKRRAQEAGEDGQAPRRRRARSLTPEDAESQTVDLQKLKMADLTKDLHIGKKFSRHDELRERERQKRIKAKLERDGEGDASGDGYDSLRAKEQSATPSAPPVEPPAQAPAGPQFRIVDGQIVVDQNSLSVDRHARAAAARAGEDMETIEENDFTRLITSNSFMNTSKLKGPNVWTEQETVLFYRGLAMFGTDFEIISKMIPGKQRRHVKLKFNREERHCPRRVNAALVGEKTVAMDMDEYRAATGTEFEPVEVIEAEQKKIEDSYEAERQRIADEQAEVMRKKKEELFADEDVDMAGVVIKKKKKKGKNQSVEYGLNGEPITEE